MRTVTLNPEDIARRTFAIEERGYDRDEVRKFLFEVAASLRLALHGGQSALSIAGTRAPATDSDRETASPPIPEILIGPASTPTDTTTTPTAPAWPQPADPTRRFDHAWPKVLPDALAARVGQPEPDGRTEHPAAVGAETLAEAEHGAAGAGLGTPVVVPTGSLDAFGGAGLLAAIPVDADLDGGSAPGLEPVDHFTRLGAEVADVLRAAHDAVGLMQEQAEAEADAIRIQADTDADATRRRADIEAASQVDRAKRVLMTAQEQAEGIISEAEAQARAVLTGARDQAEEHAQQVAARARRYAEQILRAERESLGRLHEAQAHVAEAIEMLADSETRPVVDLTDARPNVRFGNVKVEMENDDALLEAGELASKDPVARMVRAAVGRAVTGAAEHAGIGADDSPEAAPGPAAAAADADAATAETQPVE